MELGAECKLLLENVAHAVERTRRALCLLQWLLILTQRMHQEKNCHGCESVQVPL